MGETTKISWCSHTFNSHVGCQRVAKGCENCYAEYLMDDRYHRVKWGPLPEGTRSMTKTWDDPPRWNRAVPEGETRKVFCCSLADVFEDWKGDIIDSKKRRLWVPREGGGRKKYQPETPQGSFADMRPVTMDDIRRELFGLIDVTPRLLWLLLTKRPQNIRRMWRGGSYVTTIPDGNYTRDKIVHVPFPKRENVMLGTSVAHQPDVDEYIPPLIACKELARFLFLSVEPQIGEITLRKYLPHVDWVIIGGESSQSSEARPYQIEWAERLVDECAEFNVACFVKQVGTHAKEGAIPLQLSDHHGANPLDWPEKLRVRECPEAFYPELVTA